MVVMHNLVVLEQNLNKRNEGYLDFIRVTNDF